MCNAQSARCGCDTFPLGMAGEELHTPPPPPTPRQHRAEGKQSEPPGPQSSFLLSPGLSSLPLDLHTLPPLPLPPTAYALSLSHSPGLALPPASMHNSCLALQQSSLKPAGADPPTPPGNGVVQASLLTSTPTLSSLSFFTYNSSLLLIPQARQSRVSSQVGRHRAGFIPEVANLGPTGQIRPPKYALFGRTLLFEN